MKKRPTSVTVISWILIGIGGISVISAVFQHFYSFTATSNTMTHDLTSKSPIPIPIQYAMNYIGFLVMIISGIAMLKGRNWARFLYVIWSLIGFVIGIATSPIKAAMIPGFVIFIVIAFFLFRPKASEYFVGTEDQADVQNISIIFYIISGFFFCTVCFDAFVNGPSIMEGCIPALIALGIGLACNRFQNWKRDIGIVIASAAGFTTSLVLTISCLLLEAEFKKYFPPENKIDYISGISCIVIYTIVGIMLIKISKRNAEQG